MSFFKKIQQPEFWPSFFRVTIPFFVIVVLFSLFLNSWREIFSGDFSKVAEINFDGEKWKAFFGYKIVFSVLYGLYVTNKNVKS